MIHTSVLQRSSHINSDHSEPQTERMNIKDGPQPYWSIIQEASCPPPLPVTSFQIPLQINIMVLDFPFNYSLPAMTRELISVLCVAARFVIAKSWKCIGPLSLSHWDDKLLKFCLIDKLSALSSQKPASYATKNFSLVSISIIYCLQGRIL